MKNCFIYFLQETFGEFFIKIGKAKNLSRRHSTLQIANPHKLKLIGYIRGNSETEKKLHNKFQNLKHRGEWFRPDEELLRYIALNTIGSYCWQNNKYYKTNENPTA